MQDTCSHRNPHFSPRPSIKLPSPTVPSVRTTHLPEISRLKQEHVGSILKWSFYVPGLISNTSIKTSFIRWFCI